MRLQVSIHRHALPAINIIFTTGTGPLSRTRARDATIADFLQDVNNIVPIESEGGQWGLEDYVVEVKATADQETYYECLHYQALRSVLREDDEVVIRSLATEDLRRARLGGRHQIGPDGRHLIDGVAFGREWLKRGARPEIMIPPRKRRKNEIEGGDQTLDEESNTLLQQIQVLNHTLDDLDEDEDDDDDFAEDRADEEDEIFTEDGQNQPLRIKATAEFEDADVDDEEVEGLEEDDDDSEDAMMAGTDLELSDELKALLEEAQQLSDNDNYNRLPSEAVQSTQMGKRKREVDEQDPEGGSEFEGFPTPTRPAADTGSPTSSASSVSTCDNTTIPSSSVSDSDSETGLQRGHNRFTLSSDTSSSGSSTSDSSDSDSETSDGDSSSSNSSSDSSSEEDTTLREPEAFSSSSARRSTNGYAAAASASSASSSISNEQRQGAFGEGSLRTKRGNLRTKKKARLKHLKAEGILHPNASFADMAELNKFNHEHEILDNDAQSDIEASIEKKKRALLQQVQSDDETNIKTALAKGHAITSDDVTMDRSAIDNNLGTAVNVKSQRNNNPGSEGNTTVSEATREVEPNDEIRSPEISASAQKSFIGKATPNSPGRRAKLDLASSRRMLFSSLGLKNPKTHAAEQDLREKLTNLANSTPQRKAEERLANKFGTINNEEGDMDSWKSRIVLSAVECEIEGVKLSTPPFPFKQGWDSNANMRRGIGKKKGRRQSKYYDEDSNEDYAAQYAPDVSTLQTVESQSEQEERLESRTLSLEEQVIDDMPRPADFVSLPYLDTSNISAGAVIAFKEYELQNFQPVISKYRVARVRGIEMEQNALVIEIMLSKADWTSSRRVSDPFAIEEEDKQAEDGLRIKNFADLIEPKLIEASSIQVSETPTNAMERNQRKETSASLPLVQSSIVAESGEAVQAVEATLDMASPEPKVLRMTHIEVNTPRHNEITAIIKEAGFDSAIDQALLQLDLEQRHEAQDSPALHTRSHSSLRASRSPAAVSVQASAVNSTKPRLDSPGLVGWDSSPLRPIAADSSLLAPSQTSRDPTPTASKTKTSVIYPALSQLELDASGVAVTNDSSFQDAQRVSQPPELDTSNLQPDLDTSKLHPEYPYDDFGADESAMEAEQTQHSLSSEVPQSQLPSAVTEPNKESFLGHGLDGQASSDDGENDFRSDDPSLPSLRGLTSRQTKKVKHALRQSRGSPVNHTTNASISPPLATRMSRLRNGNRRSANSEQSESDDGVELPPVKASQSPQPRLSQIPSESQIVDLTFSSDPAAPNSDDSHQQNVSRRTRNAGKRGAGKASSTRAQSISSMPIEDEDDGVGIGKRRFLTTKKWKSRV